jgi:predicted AAA+ superfamily ATPase
MTRGFYPAIFDRSIEPGRYYRSYFQTFVERDVRLIANVSSMPDFERFIRLVAGRVGQLANLSSLATEVGVSQPTIRSWLNVLETACLIHRLPPYHENFGKRVVKTPKLYFNDTGLACYLLGIETPEQLARDPLRGNLFENFCVMELVKQRLNAGRDPGLYFFRDAHGHEVDLLFVSGSTLRPIEIKSGATFHGSFLDGVTRFRAVGGPRVQAPTVIYGGDQSFELAGARVVAWSALDAESLALPVQPAPS